MGRGSRHNIDRDEYRERATEFCRRGAELPQARLTEQLVREIRTSKETAAQIAGRLGVHVRTIDKVRTYASWRHVV